MNLVLHEIPFKGALEQPHASIKNFIAYEKSPLAEALDIFRLVVFPYCGNNTWSITCSTPFR